MESEEDLEETFVDAEEAAGDGAEFEPVRCSGRARGPPDWFADSDISAFALSAEDYLDDLVTSRNLSRGTIGRCGTKQSPMSCNY